MAFLTRTDATRKMHRFYIVTVTANLFGEWGRVGFPGTMRSRSFPQEQEARAAEQRSIRRRLQHGYTIRAAEIPANENSAS